MTKLSKEKWVIGLTGGILSGKSTALAYFAKQGMGVLSCDEIVRQLYENPCVLKKIKTVFGSTDKQVLAQLVFKYPAKRKQLERILHPLVLKEARKQLQNFSQRIVVFEVPLLFEAGWDKYTNFNIAVLADAKTLPARLAGRHMKRTEYERRLKEQMPPTQKALYADVVFFHQNKAQLKKHVERFCTVLNLLDKHK